MLVSVGLCLSSTVPGFLITSSFDETVKIWDIENGAVTFITERQFQTVNKLELMSCSDRPCMSASIQQGRINTCLANPDFPFTFAFGGQSKGLQIWDCTENSQGMII
jgi:WD40 repeat protein